MGETCFDTLSHLSCCKRLGGYPTEHYDALLASLNAYKFILLASKANEDVESLFPHSLQRLSSLAPQILGPDRWQAWTVRSVRRMRDSCLKLLYDRVGKAVADEERKLQDEKALLPADDVMMQVDDGDIERPAASLSEPMQGVEASGKSSEQQQDEIVERGAEGNGKEGEEEGAGDGLTPQERRQAQLQRELQDPANRFPRNPKAFPQACNIGADRALLANLWAMQSLYIELLDMVKPVLGVAAVVDSNSKAR